jgi:maleamate amidohydrolase
MPIWDDLFSAEELAVRAAGGYAARVGMGERPAVLVIDVVYGFTGDKGDDHLASVAKFRTSCGPAAWIAIPHIQRLLATARDHGLPIIYTRALRLPPEIRGTLRPKKSRSNVDTPEARARGNEFTAEIAPHQGDIVVEKTTASAFFQTPLLAHLQMVRADHVIVAGTSTSGCVRATVYDAFAYKFGVTVVEECVFDRFPTSHKVNLFDMDSKFGDVEPLDAVVTQIAGITPWRRAPQPQSISG